MPITIRGGEGGISIGGNNGDGGIQFGKGVKVTITGDSKFVEGDLVKVNGEEVTGAVAENVKVQAQAEAEKARAMADQLRQQAQEAVSRVGVIGRGVSEAPEIITSPDFVGGRKIVNGVSYRMTGETDPKTGEFIYKRVS